MLNNFTSILVAIAPGLFGALIAAYFGRQNFSGKLGVRLVISGCGGICGYLTLALAIRALDSQGIFLFTQGFKTTILLFYVALAFALIAKFIGLSTPKFGSIKIYWGVCVKNAGFFFPLLFSVFVMGYVIFNSLFVPISAWDTLHTWADWSIDFLAYESAGIGFGSVWFHPRHPPTVYHLMAFNAFAFSESPLLQGFLLPWLFAWACGGMVVFGFVLAISHSAALAFASVYLYLSFPLLENHALLLGYMDLWVTVVVTGSTAILALSLRYNSRKLALFGICFSLALVLLKNTGILYLASIWVALAVIRIEQYSRRLLSFAAGLGAFVAICMFWVGFDVTVSGLRYGFIYGVPSRVFFGGWTYEVTELLVLGALWNQFWAFCVEQSFSTLMAAGIVVIWALGNATGNESIRFTRGGRFIITVSIFILIFFTLPQVLSEDYSQIYAAPGTDTGNSRFLMAAGCVLLMMFAFVEKRTAVACQGNNFGPKKVSEI